MRAFASLSMTAGNGIGIFGSEEHSRSRDPIGSRLDGETASVLRRWLRASVERQQIDSARSTSFPNIAASSRFRTTSERPQRGQVLAISAAVQ